MNQVHAVAATGLLLGSAWAVAANPQLGNGRPGVPPLTFPHPPPLAGVAVLGQADIASLHSGLELLEKYPEYADRIQAKADEMGVSLDWDTPPELPVQAPPLCPRSGPV